MAMFAFDEAACQPPDVDLIDLDRVLSVAAFDARKSQVAELRFFGGLPLAETGHVSPVATVEREWVPLAHGCMRA